MGKFGQTLKKFRENKSISKVKLAKNIGTSDAYLRQIENQGYKPPTYDLCEKICFELSLTDNEKKELLESAFIERISSEEKFYNLLKKDVFNLSSNNDNNIIKIHFQPLISNAINNNILELKTILFNNLVQTQLDVENFSIDNQSCHFELISIVTNDILKKIETFMHKSSDEIKNDFSDFNQVATIWKKEISITENKPSNDSVTISSALEYVTQL